MARKRPYWKKSDEEIKMKLYRIIERQGDDIGLLSIISSWKDSVPNEITIACLEKAETRLSNKLKA